MSDEALIGIQKCGCVTYANTRPDDLDRQDQKAIKQILGNGGSVQRTTVERAKARKHFMPAECPHDPKGWKYTPPKPFEPTVRCKQTYHDAKAAYVKTHEWSSGVWSGEVAKREGGWYSTPGWFDGSEKTAHYGDDSAEVFGPFKTQREAARRLIPLAVESMEALRSRSKAAA